MPTYTIRLRMPFRTPAGRALDTYEQDIVLENPPARARLALDVRRYGRRYILPINIGTVDASGTPLANGTIFEITWPSGVEIAPDITEVASVARPDGTAVDVLKEIYRG